MHHIRAIVTNCSQYLCNSVKRSVVLFAVDRILCFLCLNAPGLSFVVNPKLHTSVCLYVCLSRT